MVKRLSVFPWSQNVTERDTTLKKKIINTELVTVLLRCIVSYRMACERFANDGFWEKVSCDLLNDTKNEVTADCNPLAKFLRDGNDYCQVCFEPAVKGKDGAPDQKCSVTSWEELEKIYVNHQRYVLKLDKCLPIDDKYPLAAAGYVVKIKKFCKVCGLAANEATCGPKNKSSYGDHWNDGKNRRNKVVVKNMRLNIKKSLPA